MSGHWKAINNDVSVEACFIVLGSYTISFILVAWLISISANNVLFPTSSKEADSKIVRTAQLNEGADDVWIDLTELSQV